MQVLFLQSDHETRRCTLLLVVCRFNNMNQPSRKQKQSASRPKIVPSSTSSPKSRSKGAKSTTTAKSFQAAAPALKLTPKKLDSFPQEFHTFCTEAAKKYPHVVTWVDQGASVDIRTKEKEFQGILAEYFGKSTCQRLVLRCCLERLIVTDAWATTI